MSRFLLFSSSLFSLVTAAAVRVFPPKRAYHVPVYIDTHTYKERERERERERF
jgi:hypothetical protein